jgi:hypothetical protein
MSRAIPFVLLTALALAPAHALAAKGGKKGQSEAAPVAAAPAGPADPAAAAAAIAEGDTLWAERLDTAKLEAALAAYEKAHRADPKNRYALQQLTRGWYFLGDSHQTDKDQKIATWEKAIGWGKTCLALNEDYAKRIASEAEKDAVASARKEDAPCIYWLASALGKWGRIQGIAKVLGQLPTVKAFISKVEELDPQYFHYGPARYWGAFYSSSSFTRDDEKSRAYFQASIDGAPYYLPTRGLRAEQFAVLTKDYALFADDVQSILAFDVSSMPELVAENTLEQKKAKALWERRAELFDAESIAAWEASQPK